MTFPVCHMNSIFPRRNETVIKGGNITLYTRRGSKTTRAVIPAESDAHLTILNIKNSRNTQCERSMHLSSSVMIIRIFFVFCTFFGSNIVSAGLLYMK